MAEQGCTVSVSGIPTDIDDDRLSDKLCIHFLRVSNGGGDIASITIGKTTPGSALITFEDSEVAHNVLQHGRHILRVDGKKYELTLSEHREDLDPDKVILSMSVTVDYSQLPQGKTAVMQLHRNHPDVQVDYDSPEELCTLRGLYSEVQAAVAQLLGLPRATGTTDAPSAVSNITRTESASPPHRGRRYHTQETSAGARRRRGDGQRESAEQTSGPSSADQRPRGDLGSGGRESVDQAEGGAAGLMPRGDRPEVEEDLSLIMDSDTFLYLRRHCGDEYQRILACHGVDVVDMTTQGVTTLFLQSAAGTSEAGGELERLRGARRELSSLYQENEARLRKAQLPKSVLFPRGGLLRAMEGLRIKLPKLLLSEDDRNVYIVGSSSDVSEAKQCLLLGEQEHKDIAGSSPSSSPNSSKPEEEERLTPALSSTAGTMDARIDKMLKSYEAERKAELARGYKLAARFKDSGVGGLGTRPTGSVTAGASSSSTRPGLGPMLTHERLFGSSRAITQNTGEDVLFKNGDPFSTTTIQEKTPPLNLVLMGKGQGGGVSPLTTTQNNLSGGTAVPPPGSASGSNLRRSSSFSGRPRPKTQDTGQSEAAEETGKATARGLVRSSSFSNRIGRDRRGVYTAELTVSAVMWQYMKQAYAARLQDMTSNLQMRDGQSEGSRDITVTLMGAESSVVTSCELELQKLVAMVTTDFCLQDLGLVELGVADPADETLEVCCAEIRRRFKKVTIQTLTDRVLLVGPKQLCSQVGAALREVFSGEAGQREGQEDHPAPSTSTMNQPVPPQLNGASSTTLLSQNHSPQLGPEGEETGDSQERKDLQRRDSTKRQRKTETEPKSGVFGQLPARRDPVLKEKVQRGGAMEMDGGRSDTTTSQSAKGKDRGAGTLNGLTSGSVSTHNSLHFTSTKDSNLHSKVSQKENRPSRPENQDDSRGAVTRPGTARSSLSAAQGRICVCGESGASLKMTGCGVTLCPRCLIKVHVHCRVCPKVEGGIHGNMAYSEVPISLPGHSKDSTVKITYCIPDGIQGEGHPSPGSTFRGGVFEAYLPLCERTHRLLPRLERAFRIGFTFTVAGRETGARVTWDCVPHKTSLQGGKSANGYPDSGYLTRLSEALTALGIEEAPAK